MMSMRLLLLTAAVTANVPLEGHAPSDDDIVPCAQLPEQEIIGVTSVNETLVAGTVRGVFLFSVGDPPNPCSQLESFFLPHPIKAKYTVFNLLNSSLFFYCDIQDCYSCWKNDKDLKWECVLHEIRSTSKDGDILYAAVAVNPSEIALRVVFERGRTSIYSYTNSEMQLVRSKLSIGGSSEEQKMMWSKVATDVSYLKQQRVVLAFSTGTHSFFVSSAHQPYEPAINAFSRDGNRSIVKIIRTCSSDLTVAIESRIDVALACEGINAENVREVGAAFYDAENENLLVTFSGDDSDAVCSFGLKQILDRFQYTWNVCQQTSIDEARECKGADENTDLPEHCYIFTRLSDAKNPDMRVCSKFDGGHTEDFYDNCALHEYASTRYRYGLLEDYRPIQGQLFAKVENRGVHSLLMLPDKTTSAYFFASDDSVVRAAASFDHPLSNATPISRPTLYKNLDLRSRFPITHLDKNGYLFINKHQVSLSKISCSALFRTCEDLQNGGFNDTLGCAYCPRDDGTGEVIQRSGTVCDRPLYATCSPVIEAAYEHPSDSGRWILVGKNLQNMKDTSVRVCDRLCDVDEHKDDRLSCTLKSPSVYDRTCSASMEGQLERHPNFIVRQSKRSNTIDVGTQVDGSDPNSAQSTHSSGSKSAPAWKVALGALAVLLIILALLAIMWGAKKYVTLAQQRERKMNAHGMQMMYNNGSDNEYQTHYQMLITRINPGLIIPMDRLKMGYEIGKGNFGVVMRATYTEDDESESEVACKIMLEPGAGKGREFVNEGLMMDRFHHPRVMGLVGIALLDNTIPVIVTELMANGDLAKYLRNPKNRPTLRNMCMFGIEIAEGMAYLHENDLIHRDLAARNCMVDGQLHIKIADFGLCRPVNTSQEYEPLHPGREMPLRWMSPEALEFEQYTMQGDIWAYGVVLWEIMTRGMQPYQNLKYMTMVLDFLKSGQRLGKPVFCPVLMHELMLDCWHHEPAQRPPFTGIPQRIQNIVRILEEEGKRTQLNAEYEQSISSRNSRSTSAATPSSRQTVSSISIPADPSPPNPTPV